MSVSQSRRATLALRQVARNAPTAGERAMALHKLEERHLLRLARGKGPDAAAARRRLARMLAASPEELIKDEDLHQIVDKDVMGRKR